MKAKALITILLMTAAIGLAQDQMADTLRQGIVEEDSRQDVNAAIRQYSAVMNQFADARQTAATALFRMAECYRKQGNRQQAIATYQRVVKEFPDQNSLFGQSVNILSTIYKEVPNAHARKHDESADVTQARARASLEQQINAAQQQSLQMRLKQQRAGVTPDTADLDRQISNMKRALTVINTGRKR